MPAKKAVAKPAASSDMDMVWKWVYVLGTLVAGVLGGLLAINATGKIDLVTYLLLLAAVLVGWFYFDPDEVGQFGLRVLVLSVAQAGLNAVPAVGPFITGFVGGWLGFLYPVVLAMAFHFFWNRRIAPLFQ